LGVTCFVCDTSDFFLAFVSLPFALKIFHIASVLKLLTRLHIVETAMRCSRIRTCSKQLLGPTLLTALLQSDASALSATGRAGGVNVFCNAEFAAKPWQPSTVEMQQVVSVADGSEESHIVFYFETNRPQGLASFRRVSMACSRQELPGYCRNLTSVGGFGTWCIPKSDLRRVVGSNPSFLQLPDS
jgi:hypothetical protein